MRVRLLTVREESIIRAYVEGGEKLEGFAMLKHRFNKTKCDVGIICDQIDLLAAFKYKLEAEK